MRVRLQDVHVSVSGTPVVHGVDLDVAPGRVLGLVGPNGCGKSTLLRSLYRVNAPTRGRVLLDEDDAWTLPRSHLARRVAVMAQEGASDFDLDVLDLVLLGRVPHQRGFGADSPGDLQLAHGALAEVDAAHLAGRVFASLSGGEKQRVLLARCLVQEPSVLVLDEPTNHLDVAFQHDLLALVRGQGLTTVMALHDLNLALAYCDDLAVMDAGRLVAVGPPEQVLDADLIGEVFGVGAHLLTHPQTGRPLIAFSPSTRHIARRHAAPPAVASGAPGPASTSETDL